jgi:hypothetical protein
MRQREFGHGEHLDNITLKDILDLVEVYLCEVAAGELRGGVVN